MNIIEITTFEHVLLLALQRKYQTTPEQNACLLSFSEIWKWCSTAGSRLPNPQLNDVENKKSFAWNLIDAVNDLEKRHLIWVYRTGDKRIINIGLTKSGMEYIGGIIFSHQQERRWQ